MNLLRFNIDRFCNICFAFSIFFLIPPFFTWNVSPIIFIVFCICVCLFELVTAKISNTKMLFASLILLFYFYIAWRDGITIIGSSFYLLIFGTLFLMPYHFIIEVFRRFISIYSILLIPSIIIFVFVVYLQVNIPYDTIEPINIGKDYNYLHFPFLIVPNLPYVQQLRFIAFFDEPGVVGTIAAILLMCNKFNFRNKINIPIFISGILSLSISFYIVLFMYVLCFSPIKQKILIAIPIIIAIWLLSSNQIFSHLILNRLQLNSSGVGIAGNNRTSAEMDFFYRTFLRSNKLLFGYGNHYSAIINYGGSSYKDLLIDYGVFGFLFMLLIYFSYALTIFKFSKKLIIYLFVFFIIIYQRPYITLYFYVFLLFAPLFYLSDNNSE